MKTITSTMNPLKLIIISIKPSKSRMTSFDEIFRKTRHLQETQKLLILEKY